MKGVTTTVRQRVVLAEIAGTVALARDGSDDERIVASDGARGSTSSVPHASRAIFTVVPQMLSASSTRVAMLLNHVE